MKHVEKRALLALSRTGRWMRRTHVGVTRNALMPLVEKGLVRKNDKRRYRITGKGFEALENEP